MAGAPHASRSRTLGGAARRSGLERASSSRSRCGGADVVAPLAEPPVRCPREALAIVRALILTHGRLADELLAAARKIVGDNDHLAALSLEWDDGFEAAREKLVAAVAKLGGNGDRLLILTDIHGGTPYNVAVTLRDPERVEVLTGVNLPMVVRLGCLGPSDRSLVELANWIRDKSRRAICRHRASAPQGRSGDGGA